MPNIKIYNREEVLESSLKYFKGDELAANVWISKYCLKNTNGDLFELNPSFMHKRLAKEFARIELKYPNPMSEDEIFDLIENFKYIVPQGSPMSGIGNNNQFVSISNCFVIGNDADSYGGLMLADQEQVQLMKRRGGVGNDLSSIRPKGSPVNNSALTSTGVVPFMERYSNSTNEVAQDGRRGALMLSINISHPDAEDFIDAKLDSKKVTGANISVKIDDNFMNCLLENTNYIQKFVFGDGSEVSKEVSAIKIWNKIIHNAHKSAEPGILFWDTIIDESLPDCYADLGYKTVSTNPCGEIPLCPYDSCRLLIINLYSYVENPFTPQATFNFDLFKKHVTKAQRMMDDIVDLEIEKIDMILNKIKLDNEEPHIKRVESELWNKIREKCEEGRRTGLGITAEGDMIAALGLRYGTKDATDFSVEVHKVMDLYAHISSNIMAKERGAFPIFDYKREKNNPYFRRIVDLMPGLEEDIIKYGRRNIALTTIAPTGTTSLMTQTTSGIEPVFLPVYKRRKKINPNDKNSRIDFVDELGVSWEEYNVFHHKFLDWAVINGYDKDELVLLKNDEINEIVKKSPYYKATSNDVDWVEKVRMQGEVQKYVSHSISVTVNLPNDTTEEIVDSVYRTAWKSGCKGITIYRDGSRAGVLVSTDDKKEEELTIKLKENHAPKRPKNLECKVVRFKNKGEEWVGFVGILEEKPYEIFSGKMSALGNIPKLIESGIIRKSKDENKNNKYDFIYKDKNDEDIIIHGLGDIFDSQFYNVSKMTSGLLRHGMPTEYVIELLDTLDLDNHVGTWVSGIKRILKKFIKDGKKYNNLCPECNHDSMIFQDGCLLCTQCGHSKCG